MTGRARTCRAWCRAGRSGRVAGPMSRCAGPGRSRRPGGPGAAAPSTRSGRWCGGRRARRGPARWRAPRCGPPGPRPRRGPAPNGAGARSRGRCRAAPATASAAGRSAPSNGCGRLQRARWPTATPRRTPTGGLLASWTSAMPWLACGVPGRATTRGADDPQRPPRAIDAPHHRLCRRAGSAGCAGYGGRGAAVDWPRAAVSRPGCWRRGPPTAGPPSGRRGRRARGPWLGSRRAGPPRGSATSSLRRAAHQVGAMAASLQAASHSSSGSRWAAGGRRCSPRRTSSFSVNVRGQASGSSSTTSRA